MKKKKPEHIGEKIQRFRAFRGMTQQDLANAIGKTRSLISTLETTGHVNLYTLNDIAKALSTSVEDIEAFPPPNAYLEEPKAAYKEIDQLKSTIEQQKAEIDTLKDIVQKQWRLIQDLSKSRKK